MPPHDPLGQLQRLRARLVRKRDLRWRRPCGRPYANGIVVFEGHLRVHVTAMGIEEAKTTITHHHTQVQVLLLIRPHRQVHFHTGNVPVITDVEDGFETGTADGRARVPRAVIVAAKGAQVRAAVGGVHRVTVQKARRWFVVPQKELLDLLLAGGCGRGAFLFLFLCESIFLGDCLGGGIFDGLLLIVRFIVEILVVRVVADGGRVVERGTAVIITIRLVRHLRQSITKSQAQDAALRGTVKAVAKLRGAARRARRRTAGGGSGGQLFLVACCAVLLVPVFIFC